MSDTKTMTVVVSQVIPPEEQSGYALNDRTRALAADKYLTTLDGRDPAPGVRGRVSRFLEWVRDPMGTVEDVHHAVFEERPPEGEKISVTLEPLAPDLWEATEFQRVMTDGRGLTKNCPDCSGSGEFVEVERDGRVEAVRGVEAMERIRDGDWTYDGVRECANCAGYGHVDARTGEV